MFKSNNQAVNFTLASILSLTHKGYTGHEQVDHASVVQMGGRIYDAHIGRFLQADPFVQSPSNSQNFNRYSYVLNNPLSYTDPSGYLFKKLKKYLQAAAAIAIGIYLPGSSLMASWGVSNAVAQGALTGFIAGGVATGTLKGALVGAFTGGLFGELQSMSEGFSKVAAHGVVGGMGSAMQGGKFGHGFLSAGVSAQLSPKIQSNVGDAHVRVAIHAAIGGTVSKVTGGKFANGAYSAAFSSALREGAQKFAGASKSEVVEQPERRTIVRLEHKNIPGGDRLGNTDPDGYPQHAFVIVRDNMTGEEWIARAGPGGEGGNAVFGSIKAKMVPNVLGSTEDYGAQINYSQVVLTTNMAPQTIVDRLSTFKDVVNHAQISYNPLMRNSNSFAYQAVEVLTGARPTTDVWAPGSQTRLRVEK
ncbi:hypothetical protein CWE08_11905 [Aliidiomarina iranensis]|uniref:RHS repeat-associated core domain-containing protein n=1 Tax=Aliidiomarina iranensis TaxID=1434071 RepID=A0A432VPV5_9GAMM|nr:RHS repeat-associated core domain-containing protein [Aliidiomarina iranensis]RUO18183.1 hypothetical protein CWE08_11905 [Aliidiomarina iranensis]